MFQLDETTQTFNVYQLVRAMAEEASSVVMEFSNEESEQIDGGERSYGREDVSSCSKQLSSYLKKNTRKNVNSMAVSSHKVKHTLVKPRHRLIKK